MDFTTAQPGHNNPPSDIEILSENITMRHVALIRSAEKEIEKSSFFPEEFTQKEEADYASDYIKILQDTGKALEGAREMEKEPFLRQGQFVDGFFRDLRLKIDQAIKRATTPLSAYLDKEARAEAARRAEEAAELQRERDSALAAVANSAAMAPQNQKEAIEHAMTMTHVAEVAQQVATAPVASMASAGGAISRAGLKRVWVGEIKDVAQLDMFALRSYFTAKELQNALDRFIKMGGRHCTGAVIKEVMETKVK